MQHLSQKLNGTVIVDACRFNHWLKLQKMLLSGCPQRTLLESGSDLGVQPLIRIKVAYFNTNNFEDEKDQINEKKTLLFSKKKIKQKTKRIQNKRIHYITH